MAGLLSSNPDFERWYAGLMANRPVSHPFELNRDDMYQLWLLQQMQRRGVQPTQMPAALGELSALSPTMPATSLALQDPATLRTPPPPARPQQRGDFASRLRGPGSANIIDQRADFGIGNVANWLRGFPGEDF